MNIYKIELTYGFNYEWTYEFQRKNGIKHNYTAFIK